MKQLPKYMFQLRWGDFELSITGRRTILWWAGFAGLLMGAKIFGAKLLDLL